MTCTPPRGFEFDTVFLPGWEEGLLPHQRSLDDQGPRGLEEERRLAHVGINARAAPRKNLFHVEPAHHGRGRRAFRRAFSTSCPRRMCR